MMELFEGNQYAKRVVIWYYNNNGELDKEYSPKKAKITDNTGASKRSIRSTE